MAGEVGDGSTVVGHGLLSRFHQGCRCPWCSAQVWERSCACDACVVLRSVSPFVLPMGDRGEPAGAPAGRSVARRSG